jgi:hypothetical protein
MNGPDKGSEVVSERSAKEMGKSPVALSKAELIRGVRGSDLSQL